MVFTLILLFGIYEQHQRYEAHLEHKTTCECIHTHELLTAKWVSTPILLFGIYEQLQRYEAHFESITTCGVYVHTNY